MRSICAPWERGDFSSADWADPQIEYVVADGPSPGSWTGLAGMAEAVRALLSAWEQHGVEADEYRELDGERVLVLFNFTGRGKTSGLEVGPMQAKGAHVFHVRDGQVTMIVVYLDGERALADLGLAPKARLPVMGSANLDLAHSIYAAWERGDYSSAEWADPEIEYVIADGPTAGSWRGLAATAKAVREGLSGWQDFHQEAEEYRELDDERVLVLVDWRGRGKTSGLELGQMRAKGADVLHVRGGKVTRLVTYFDRDRALTDLGLAPDAGFRGS